MHRSASPLRWLALWIFLFTAIACGPAVVPPPTTNEDLQELQGLWEARWSGHVIRREIVGAREVVSYYGPDGLLLAAHTADVEALRSADGRLRVLRWYNLRRSVGAPVGPAVAQGEYLYTLEGATLTEHHGATPEKPTPTENIVWTRLSGPPAPAAVAEPY